MMNVIKNLHFFISKKNKIHLIFFIILSFFSSFLEMIGIGMIPLFISIYLKTGPFYENLPSVLLNFTNSVQLDLFLIYSSVIIISIFIIKNFILYQVHKFYLIIFNNITIQTTNKVYENFIRNDFLKFQKYSLGEKLRDLTVEANNSTVAIMQIFSILQDLITLIFIVSLIFITSNNVVLFLLLSLFLIALLFLSFYGKKLKKIGQALLKSRKNLFKTIYQTSNLIREIKITSKENFFLKIFRLEQRKLIDRNLSRILIVSIPKYVFEIGAVVFVFGIIFFQIEIIKTDLKSLVPILALIIIASLRVLPIANELIRKISNAKSVNVSFDLILEILKNTRENNFIEKKYNHSIIKDDLPILEFRKLSHRYDELVIFDNQEIKIKKNSVIGIYGKSGSGKSTLLDILMGIIKVPNSEIYFEGKKVNNLDEINYNISLVSQSPQLINASILENIAFGIEKEQINIQKVNKILKMMRLEDVINSKKDGINSIVEDNDSNLSGGQIQRIAIARALYSEPKIIFLDEPTSSLDDENSNKIKDLIYDLVVNDMSVVLISHEKELLDKCDYIYEIRNKQIKLINEK